MAHSIIAFLSARSEDYSQISGLDAGADDYITKPIRPKVLLSKVKSLLRRFTDLHASEQNSEVITLKSIVIDKEKYLVIHNNETYFLPRKEFEILYLLASKCNKVIRREEIYTTIWGNNVYVGDRTIDVHIRRLRQHTGIENIKTVKGIGYKYEE